MTIKGICAVVDVLRNDSDHSHFDMIARYVALDDASVAGSHVISDIDPSGDITAQIEDAVRLFLQGEGITIGEADSVKLVL